jgi:Putative addiction module component
MRSDIFVPLDEMTAKEKLELINLIWTDLQKNPEQVPPPEWHRIFLEERSKGVEEGRYKFLDFEEAIEQINTRIGIRRGLADVKAGRVRDAEDFFKEFEEKYGISRD